MFSGRTTAAPIDLRISKITLQGLQRALLSGLEIIRPKMKNLRQGIAGGFGG
jgi:hypothetical protein